MFVRHLTKGEEGCPSVRQLGRLGRTQIESLEREMPGRRDRNLRKGHLAEDIGVGVLRGFSAVANVRIQDDIGVDAFAVLLRREGRCLYAGSTFGVQFKSHSVDEIEYDTDETAWFETLDVPLFFARINSSEGLVSFFSSTRWNLLRPGYEYSSLTFVFDSDSVDVSKGVARVGLSPPILCCTEIASRTDDFADKAFKLFDAWIAYESENIELRRYGVHRSAKWDLEELPRLYYEGSETKICDRRAHLSRARPILDKLAFHALGSENSDSELLRSFLRIHEWYKAEGFEEGALDSSEILESQILFMNQQS